MSQQVVSVMLRIHQDDLLQSWIISWTKITSKNVWDLPSVERSERQPHFDYRKSFRVDLDEFCLTVFLCYHGYWGLKALFTKLSSVFVTGTWCCLHRFPIWWPVRLPPLCLRPIAWPQLQLSNRCPHISLQSISVCTRVWGLYVPPVAAEPARGSNLSTVSHWHDVED